MNRREFLATSAGASGTLFAGCTSVFETESLEEPPVVENRPDAVYHPTHVEGMEMVGMATADRYAFALSYSFPHRFWTVTGRQAERVSIRDDDSVHLMLTAWDAETGIVLPTASNTLELSRDGESLGERSLWPMLSQRMGYHFGDNLSLSGDGTYTATIQLAPVDARRTGEFAGEFEETATVDIEFEYDRATRDDLAFEEFGERQGEPGAAVPMEMEMVPSAAMPTRDELPGEILGDATSGDGVFVVTAVDDASRFGDGTYLAVSPRTPHNRFPLPFMSLSATLTRDGETVFDGSLRETLDPELEYHYGATVDGIESGDSLSISVDSPPQVSRHEGYETAFLEMPDAELTVQTDG